MQTCDDLIVTKCGKIWLNGKSSETFHKRIPMMSNCFGIDKFDKLHGFMMYGVRWTVGHVSRENDYSFQFSNVGSYVYYITLLIWYMPTWKL